MRGPPAAAHTQAAEVFPELPGLAQLQLSNKADRVASLLDSRPQPSWLKPTSCPQSLLSDLIESHSSC